MEVSKFISRINAAKDCGIVSVEQPFEWFCGEEGSDGDLGTACVAGPVRSYGRCVTPIRKRSHSRAAPRPSLIAQTTRD